MRHYNDSAVIKTKAINNVLGQMFPDVTPKLYAVKTHKKIIYYRQFWMLMFKSDKFSPKQFRQEYEKQEMAGDIWTYKWF